MHHGHTTILSSDRAGVHSLQVMTAAMATEIALRAGLDPARISKTKGARNIADILAGGRWDFNGEQIVIDANGRVLDGEQRLGGCIRSGIPMTTLVLTEVDPAHAHTISTHKRRTAHDTLSVMGEEDARDMQGVAAALKRIAAGTCSSLHSGSGGFSAFQIKQVFEIHPGLEDSMERVVGMNVRELPGLGRALLAAFHYAFSTVDPQKANDFFDHVDNHRSEHPVAMALAEALGRLDGLGNAHRRVPAAALLVQAWNAFAAGRETVRLRFDPDAPFPEIGGFAQLEMPEEGIPAIDHEGCEKAATHAINIFDRVLAAGGHIRIEIRTFTPDEAADILDRLNGPAHSGRNRPISKVRVAALVRDALAGRWALNGQTVKFSASGRLLDGQHRLRACVESGIPLETYVIHGLPENAFETIDAGASRTFAKSLGRLGVEDNGLLANILPVLVRWDWRKIGKGVKPTQSECIAAFEKYGAEINASLGDERFKDKDDAAVMAATVKPQWCHAANVILGGIDREAAEEFISKTVMNEGIAKGDIWYAVNHGLKAGTPSRSREGRVFHILFDGWNRARAGHLAAPHKLYTEARGAVPEPV